VQTSKFSQDIALQGDKVQIRVFPQNVRSAKLMIFGFLYPMSLKLAASVVHNQGLDQLRSVETRRFLFLRLKAETVQARLYGRILAHVHDEDVRKLATLSLAVRRSTPEII
jgi:hypothetical protein